MTNSVGELGCRPWYAKFVAGCSWCDNEWGYSNRLADLVAYVGAQL